MSLLETIARRGLAGLVPAAGLLLGCAGSEPYGRAARLAHETLESYVGATGVPALQVAVATGGRIVWSENFGFAELAPRRPATAGSRFRIASVSKLLTGTLASKLARDGVLELDRPIGEYVPDLPEAWQSITARMLAHHTSGIPHYAGPEDALDTTYYRTTRAAVARFRDRPLAHPPGEGETYSSYAYTLLALAIEHAAGRPFLEVMREEILDTAGMTHTEPDRSVEPHPDRTGLYQFDPEGEIEEAPSLDLSGRWAGSGYLSTAEDLARFGAAHAGTGPFAGGIVELVSRPMALPDGSLTREGFGWGPREDWDGRPMLWGDGSTAGSRCGLLVYPEDDLAIAILTNARGLALERGEFQALARLFFAERAGTLEDATPAWAVGSWSASIPFRDRVFDLHLEVEPPEAPSGGRAEFSGWRRFEIAQRFQVGDTLWLLPLDARGFFPLALVHAPDSIRASAPRADWSFRLAPAGASP